MNDLNIKALEPHLTPAQLETFTKVYSCMHNTGSEGMSAIIGLLAVLKTSGLGTSGPPASQDPTVFRILNELLAATKTPGEHYQVWDDPDPDNNGVYVYVNEAGGAGTGPGLVKVAHAVVNPSGGTATGGVTEARVNELIDDNRGSYKDYATPADIPDNHIGRVDGKLYSKDEGSDQPDLLRDQS